MDKSCQSSADQYLKNLNKLSHKISKPLLPASKSLPPPPPFDPNPSTLLQPPPPHQPPVYNINKNDFRDVVQKLTGSPAHERFSTPPPIQPPKPPSSRLQRIRPPPLAHLSNRPPPPVNTAVPMNPPPPAASSTFVHQPPAPLSPLPPFPAVHAAAESPVSAYMRYLQNSGGDSNKQFPGFSPRWNNQGPGILPSPMTSQPQPQFQLPASPLPFGCLSPPPFFSPGLLLSPSAFPLSPTLPVPSPKWRSL